MRTYIVLRSDESGYLQPVELTEANGAHQAIKRAREARQDNMNPGTETWHAVPARNWTTVSVVTKVPAPTTAYIDAELEELPLRPAPEPTEDSAPDADPPATDPADLADTDNGGDKTRPVAA